MQSRGKKSAFAQFEAQVGLAEWRRKGIITNYSTSGIHEHLTSPPEARRGTSRPWSADFLHKCAKHWCLLLPLTPGESLTHRSCPVAIGGAGRRRRAGNRVAKCRKRSVGKWMLVGSDQPGSFVARVKQQQVLLEEEFSTWLCVYSLLLKAK